MSHEINITRIKAVNKALGDLKNNFVFVGGATVSLYADRMAEESRPTDDVDILVELYSRWNYADLEEILRQIGFKNDITSKFVGRYIINGVTVDLMPTSEEILGFSNQWYKLGFQKAIGYIIDEYDTVKILPPPYFIASKIEAFKNRSGGDGRLSHDFEDIVFVIENRNSIWNEMNETDLFLKEYLQKEFTTFSKNPYFEEWVDANVSFNSPPSTYYLIQKVKEFINSGKK